MAYIKTEKQGFVLTITIDRPKALNALSKEVLDELEAVIDAICVDDTRCIIVTGAGEKSFVAGADIAAMLPLSKPESQTWCLDGNRVFRKLETCPVPSIAAVNGFALGGGCELAMACDIRIASDHASFGQPEVTLGIPAGFGGTQRMARLIGPGKAKELLYTARRIKAPEALSIGLVNAVVPQAELMDKAREMAESIAKNAPIAVRATKTAINDGLQTDMDGGIQIEAQAFAACFETNDQKNAMSAFVEKRTADPFENR